MKSALVQRSAFVSAALFPLARARLSARTFSAARASRSCARGSVSKARVSLRTPGGLVDPWQSTRAGSSAISGFVAGAGATLRVGKADLFAEYARYPMAVWSTGLSPLSFGIRF